MKPIFVVSFLLLIAVFLLPFVALGGLSPSGAGEGDEPPLKEIPTMTSFISAAPAPTAPLASGAAVSAAGGDGQLIVRALVKGELREITMRDYLFGVVAAEMPADFPAEALRAQAVAARTYIENKMLSARGPDGPPAQHMGADVCDDYRHCKAYVSREEAYEGWGGDADRYAAAVEAAVRDTDGLAVVYENEPIVAVFFAVSAGRTESAKDVWGADIPYLQAIDSPGEDGAQGYEAQVSVPTDEARRILLDAYPDALLDGPPSDWFGEAARSESGGVLRMSVGGVSIPGVKLRELFNLRSTHLTVTPEADALVFDTLGYGHGVGLSQYGAKLLAESGMNFVEILKWYYTGVEVEAYTPSFA
jgi:stage II sporulation protein D